MRQLVHNGIYIPEKPKPKGITIKFRGRTLKLTAQQEEMVIAWAKKINTKYAKDRVFVKNFFKCLGKALGIKEKVKPADFDFSQVLHLLEEEKQRKKKMSKQEKEKIAAERRRKREAIQNKFGYAILDGMKVPIENFIAEPSMIFMGCARHPLRGMWKEGIRQEDIILNLSPDAPVPPGKWKKIVWKPNVMWVAQWRDPLTKRLKYAWLAPSTPLRQLNDIRKFQKARELDKQLEKVRQAINRFLTSPDEKLRKIATVCYLIDSLAMRVGDEKYGVEANTVGACTLKPSNIKIKPNNHVLFDFYGKQAVKWYKERVLPDQVIKNLQEFKEKAKDKVFEGINSKMVNHFLDSIMPGLTAKVFRTHHATKVVAQALANSNVTPKHPDYIKKHALIMANLGAAVVCNHKQAVTRNWRERIQKLRARLEKLKGKKTKRARIRRRKLKLRIQEMRMTKDYNLRTSLRNYIDPRVIKDWCDAVEYDWKKYYPKALRERFSWIEKPLKK